MGFRDAHKIIVQEEVKAKQSSTLFRLLGSNRRSKMTRSFFKGWWLGKRAIKSASSLPLVQALSGVLNAN